MQIRSSLNEKELLLQEIQHRVKNNLQVITSLIDLQSEHLKDNKVKNVLNETQNRIRSRAFIHEELHQSKNFDTIEFGEYVNNLGIYLFGSYGVNSEHIKLKINVGNVSLNTDTAILCGLIVNELVSNSLKHAFPNGRKGQVFIELKPSKNNCILIVSDNGIGLPKGLNYRKTKSLGLQLLVALTGQLDGSIRISKKSGTSFKITFPEKNNNEVSM